MVGREGELAEALRRLARPDVRLLTLVGAPGAGKTRLARVVAVTAEASFEHGLSFVDLAPIRDPALVLPAIGESLGIPETGDRPLADSLRAVLRDLELLLLLDNFEHLLPAAPHLADLLAACPALKVLVTSRAPLLVSAEHQLEVLPLAVPDLGHLPEPDVLRRVPAVSLFDLRAQAVRSDWALSTANARSVAEICVRLDGLPLAIELAAAWTRVLPPRALRERLAAALDLPAAAAQDQPARHRTLRAAIDWSHELLDPEERTLLRRCAVFAGGWTLEAAATVAADRPSGSAEPAPGPALAPGSTPSPGLLRTLAGLVDKHVISSGEQPDGEARFTMLQTVCGYAWERLEAAGESEAARRQHAAFFLGLAERAEQALLGPAQRAWLDLLEREHANLRAALDWSAAAAEPPAIEAGLRIGGALWLFWDMRGHAREGQERLAALLGRASDCRPGVARVRALNASGYLALLRTDYATARAQLEESERLARELGDSAGLGRALAFLGMAVALGSGDLERAADLHEESLRVARAGGDTWSEGLSLYGLGHVAGWQGDWPGATARWEECLAVCRRVGDTWAISYLQLRRGLLAAARGEHARARQLLEESLDLSWQVDHTRGIALSAEGLAFLYATAGQAERAAVLFGIAEALLELASYHLPPYLRDSHEVGVARARQRLGSEAMAAAWTRGRALPLGQAVTFALGAERHPCGGPAEPARWVRWQPPGRLSQRECEVAILVARGYTNQQISAELVIAERTVSTHLERVFRKLHLHARAQLGAWAAAEGLLANHPVAVGHAD